MKENDVRDLYIIHETDQMVEELLRNGDLVVVGTDESDQTLFEPTAKGVAKGVLAQFATVTGQADEESRNYTTREKQELLKALHTLRQALRRKRPFSTRRSPFRIFRFIMTFHQRRLDLILSTRSLARWLLGVCVTLLILRAFQRKRNKPSPEALI